MGRSGNAKNPSFTPLPYLPVTLMQKDLVDLETCKVISRGRKGKVLTPAHFGCLQGNSILNPELLDFYSKNTGYALFHYQAILDSVLQDYPVKTFFGNRMFPTNRGKKNRR